jgi:hypothetical protein
MREKLAKLLTGGNRENRALEKNFSAAPVFSCNKEGRSFSFPHPGFCGMLELNYGQTP